MNLSSCDRNNNHLKHTLSLPGSQWGIFWNFPPQIASSFPAKAVDFSLKYCLEGQNLKSKSTGRTIA